MKKDFMQVYSAVNSGAKIQDLALRVVDYARVSTASQEQRKSFENQMETYRGIIEETANWTYCGTYCDEAVTGTKAALRGGFQQMILDAQAGKFDLIIVKDVARFARNIKECLVYKDKLKSYGVMIYFVKDNINSFRAGDDTMLKFMALGAEMEARSARERTKIVFEQGIQKGRVYGNSKILGYRKDHCRLVIDDTEAETVRLIFALYVHRRMGLRRIAKELVQRGITRSDGTQIPTRTIQFVLENPKYKGYFCGGKTERQDLGDKFVRRNLPKEQWLMYKDDNIPAIVSEALWDEAARIRAEKQDKFKSEVSTPCNQGVYSYSGKIESGAVPGLHYTRVRYTTKTATREGWQCRNYKDAKHPGNVGPTLYTDELDEIMRAMLRELLGGYDHLIADLMQRYRATARQDQCGKRLAALGDERAKIEKRRKKLLELYEDDGCTRAEYVERDAEHKKQLVNIDSQTMELRTTEEASREMLTDLHKMQETIVATVQSATLGKETIDTLIQKIVVGKDSTKREIHLEVELRCIPLTRKFKILHDADRQTETTCNLCSKHSLAYTTCCGPPRRPP